MTLTARHFRDLRDLNAMHAVLTDGRQSASRAYYVHPGDLNWWLFYSDENYLVDKICLWELNSRLAGWSLLSNTSRTFDVFVRPELHGRSLEAKILLWAEETQASRLRNLQRRDLRSMWISEDDLPRRRWMEMRGFAQSPHDMFVLECSLTGSLPEAPLPAGFTVRSVSGEAEAESRARASYGAFGSSRPFDSYCQRMLRFMRSPIYRADLDLVTVAPDGRFASFCILWPDLINRVGYFEPVGTHPDFQRMGLGEAVLSEGLRRLRKLGMTRASVCVENDNPAALALYEKVGFELASRLLTYEKAIL